MVSASHSRPKTLKQTGGVRITFPYWIETHDFKILCIEYGFKDIEKRLIFTMHITRLYI